MGKKIGTKAAHYWLMNPAYAEMSNKKLLEDFKQKKKHVLADTNVPEYLENLVNRPMDVAQLIPVTGKSLSEALLFEEHWENMLCTEIVLNVKNYFCTQHVLSMF